MPTHFGVGKTKRVILPLDQAGWHITEKLQVPEGIHLLPMPPYSPELQPASRLWPLVNEPLVNQAFDRLKGGRRTGLSTLLSIIATAGFDSRIDVL